MPAMAKPAMSEREAMRTTEKDQPDTANQGEALIVEDSYHAAADLADVLRKVGWRVLVANGLSKALALAATGRPDVAFIDVNLDGGFEGFDLAREIERQTGAGIVFVTGYTADDLKGRVDSFRNAVILFKPINASSVEVALRMVASTRAERRADASD